jgi:hypothetical protein
MYEGAEVRIHIFLTSVLMVSGEVHVEQYTAVQTYVLNVGMPRLRRAGCRE